jgi:CRISPR/Cas system endoribonuclease Cas6 (RAMP superfamily)
MMDWRKPAKLWHHQNMPDPTAKRKKKRRVRNPSKLVIVSRAIVPRKPGKQRPARKSK